MRMETENVAGIFTPYLDSDEYIVWSGKPEKGMVFSGADGIVLIFGIMWLSFSVFWEGTAILSGAPFFFLLFGIPFILFGVFFLFGGVFRKAAARGRTFYAVTNKKLIVQTGRNIKMYTGQDLPPMQIKFHRNGNGSIIFSEYIYTHRGRAHTILCSLENLADVNQAQRAISMLQQSGNGSDGWQQGMER